MAGSGRSRRGLATQDKVYNRRSDMGVDGFYAVWLGWTRQVRIRLGTAGRDSVTRGKEFTFYDYHGS